MLTVVKSTVPYMMKTATTWSPQRIKAWEHMRARGRRYYILGHGVLRWGGFMLCFSLSVYHYGRFGTIFSTEGYLWFRLLIGALIWTYVGYLYGRASWHQNEREYLAQRGSAGISVEL